MFFFVDKTRHIMLEYTYTIKKNTEVVKMELFGKIFKRMKDNVKYTVITPKGNRFQGNWYQDVMLDMLLNYRYNAAKIITENVIEIYGREIESEESLQMEMRIKKIMEDLSREFLNENIYPNEDMAEYEEKILEIFGDMKIDDVSEVIVNDDKENMRITAYINHENSPEYYINYGTTGISGEYIVNSINVRRAH